jgi:hypothetical protein
LSRIVVILAAKGGTLAEVTVGDCVELLQIVRRLGGGKTTSGYFYQLLHALGIFDPSAPRTAVSAPSRRRSEHDARSWSSPTATTSSSTPCGFKRWASVLAPVSATPRTW